MKCKGSEKECQDVTNVDGTSFDVCQRNALKKIDTTDIEIPHPSLHGMPLILVEDNAVKSRSFKCELRQRIFAQRHGAKF